MHSPGTFRKIIRKLPRPLPARFAPWFPREERRLIVEGAPSGGQNYQETPSGGFVLGGSSTVSQEIQETPGGGFVLGGSAPVSHESFEQPSGGFVLNGSSSVSQEHIESGAGGLVLGGSGNVSQDQSESGSGGFVTNGTTLVSQEHIESASGGLVLGGSSSASQNQSESGSGGFTFSGSSSISQEHSESGSGGFILNGSAPETYTPYISYSGGKRTTRKNVRKVKRFARPMTVLAWDWITRPRQVIVASTKEPSAGQNYQETPSGGFVLNGSAPVSQENVESGSGGFVLGGSSSASQDQSETPSGGFVFTGTAPVIHEQFESGAGGFVLGGSSSASQDQSESGSGGFVFTGTSPIVYEAIISGDGGFVLGGSAPLGGAVIPEGGFVFTGTAPVIHEQFESGAGGFVLGGTSDTSHSGSEIPDGGFVFGGVATVSLEGFESGSGGFVLGGSSGATQSGSETPAGGFVFHDSAPVQYEAIISGSGGFVLGGSAPIEGAFLPEGGFVFTGTVSLVHEQFETGAGGFVLGGSADASQSTSETAEGGFVFHGSSSVDANSAITPDGGFVFSGDSTVQYEAIVSAAGGFVLDGTSDVTSENAETPDGGFVLGGSAEAGNDYQETPDGGLVLYGTVHLYSSELFTPSGGFVTYGAATVYDTISPFGGFVFSGSSPLEHHIFETVQGGFRFYGFAIDQLASATYPGLFYFQQIIDQCSAFSPCRPLFLSEFFRSLVTYHFSRPEGMLSDKLKHLTWDQDPRLSKIAVHNFGEFEFEDIGENPTVVIQTAGLSPVRLTIGDRHHFKDTHGGFSLSDRSGYDVMHTFHVLWGARVQINCASRTAVESEMIAWEVANLIKHFARPLAAYTGAISVDVNSIGTPQVTQDFKKMYVTPVNVIVVLPDDWEVHYANGGNPELAFDFTQVLEKCKVGTNRTEIPITIGELLRSLSTYLFQNNQLIFDPNLQHLDWNSDPRLSEIAVFNWGTFDYEELGEQPVVVIKPGEKKAVRLSIGNRLFPLDADIAGNLPSDASFGGIDMKTKQLFYTAWESSHQIVCCSVSPIESQCLAWELGQALVHLATPIRRYLGLYTLKVNGVSPPQPLEDYKKYFASAISLEYAFGDRWDVHRLSYRT